MSSMYNSGPRRLVPIPSVVAMLLKPKSRGKLIVVSGIWTRVVPLPMSSAQLGELTQTGVLG